MSRNLKRQRSLDSLGRHNQFRKLWLTPKFDSLTEVMKGAAHCMGRWRPVNSPVQ